MQALAEEAQGSFLLCSEAIGLQALPNPRLELGQYDLAHRGLGAAGSAAFDMLWYVSTNWLFLDPRSDRPAVSWKASPQLTWVRAEILTMLGGWDPAYISARARLMDLAYRLLMAGGRVVHLPDWGGIESFIQPEPEIPVTDALIFIIRHIGLSAARYAALWEVILRRDRSQTWRSWREAQRRVRQFPAPAAEKVSQETFHLIGSAPRQQVGRITAIIPTIDRYEYLPRAIESLLIQKPAPDEIIVVDQTPVARRQSEIYTPYQDQIKVIYLDEAGQSIARNTALAAAMGEWCLLFEDDTVAWGDMMERLVHAAVYSGADAVTGLVLAPWKTVENIPRQIRHYRLSDVFATGICLARKESLVQVGGLDRAFDRGSGADHDIGARLYLVGGTIVFNPHAIATHYKAPTGGMRAYGAWWRNYAGFWAPYPQPTQGYIIQKYYPRGYQEPLYLLAFAKARKQMHLPEFLWLWASLPWKLSSSLQMTAQLNEQYLENASNENPHPFK